MRQNNKKKKNKNQIEIEPVSMSSSCRFRRHLEIKLLGHCLCKNYIVFLYIKCDREVSGMKEKKNNNYANEEDTLL